MSQDFNFSMDPSVWILTV